MISILVGALVAFIIGYLWYGLVFGAYWRKLEGFTEAQLADGSKRNFPFMMLVGFLNTVLSVWVVAYLIPLALPISFFEFWKMVMIMWLGFGFTVQTGAYLWQNKSPKLVAFNAAYSVVTLTLVSAIVYFW